MAAIVTALCLLAYFLGYVLYARFLARRVFVLDPEAVTPAHELEDGVDYVPTRRLVLFGHHWASITGLSPMLGPAVAVIWGWLPAMLWVVLGALLVGCVHDFGALVVSMRARGMSIGKVTEGIIGRRAKSLFHLIIFFGIALAMGVFVYVIAVLFSITESWDPAQPLADPSSFPTAVLPSGALVMMALVMGYLLYRRKFPLLPTTAVGFVLMLLAVGGWPAVAVARSRPRELAGDFGLDRDSPLLLVCRLGPAGVEPPPGARFPQFAASLSGLDIGLSRSFRLASGLRRAGVPTAARGRPELLSLCLHYHRLRRRQRLSLSCFLGDHRQADRQ